MRSQYFSRTSDVTLGDYGRAVGRSLWVKQEVEKEFYDLFETVDSTGKEVCVEMVKIGQFPSPLRPYTRDSNGHLQVLSARGALHPTIYSLPTACPNKALNRLERLQTPKGVLKWKKNLTQLVL